uniref:HIT superfamily hydrolase (Hit) n=1 Tax=uncultured marine thaumarchaeote AD1000_66_F10 TaxID=1455930 RepID=A0A075FWB0_9ARCH|nr:HIT superfamily hydrolase (hit) [uncultured marine thaumarchaeote AD1000_66_F10]
MDCIFCNIANKVIPSRIIAETNKSIAFLDAFPLSRGHTLVIPKPHYEKVQDMTDVDNTDLFNTVHMVMSKVDKITGATLLAVHNGKDSGQEIPHVHVHLIPRQASDHAGPVHRMFDSGPNLSDEELDELCNKIKNL